MSPEHRSGVTAVRPEPAAAGSNPGDEASPGSPATGEDICPDCKGSGRIDNRPCETCGGSGRIVRGIGGA